MDDLGSLDVSEQTSVMNVRNLAGDIMRHEDGRPFTITYRSKDSEKVIAMGRAQTDKLRQFMRRTGQTLPVSTSEADAIDLLVAATVEWDIILDGKPVASDEKTFRAVYKKLNALFEQGNEHVGLRANFTKGSSET